ncbi:RNA 3'-terminal phosphate cyclase isoform X3 [Festucalex cinctus]
MERPPPSSSSSSSSSATTAPSGPQPAAPRPPRPPPEGSNPPPRRPRQDRRRRPVPSPSWHQGRSSGDVTKLAFRIRPSLHVKGGELATQSESDQSVKTIEKPRQKMTNEKRVEGVGNRRIVCPLDPKHTVSEDKLDKHLKKCNSRDKAKAAYFVENVNAGPADESQHSLRQVTPTLTSSSAESCHVAMVTRPLRQVTLCERSAAQLRHLLDKLDAASKGLACEPEERVLSHAVFQEEAKNPKNGRSAHKHLKQQSSILGHLEALGLLRRGRCFVEFGAGRGKLSHWILRALDGRGPERLQMLLVERSSARFKVDGKHRDAGVDFARLKIDIQHLDLSQVALLERRLPLVGVGKHLCGAATDLALRCLLRAAGGASAGGGVAGLSLALCCHHRCEWRHYVGRPFFRDAGLGPDDFAAFCRMSGWATCGRRAHAAPRGQEMDADADAAAGSLLSPDERERIGRRCKRLLDAGRLDFLRRGGFCAGLARYADTRVTLENVLLTATPRSPSPTPSRLPSSLTVTSAGSPSSCQWVAAEPLSRFAHRREFPRKKQQQKEKVAKAQLLQVVTPENRQNFKSDDMDANSKSPPVVELDGSVMEGGGQILRVAAALSCISGSPVAVDKVRAGRSTPGLRPQHLSGLQLVCDMCDGVLQGGAIGSTQVSLTPGRIAGGNYVADTRTAGSVCLLLQVALPCALYADADTNLSLRGGTNAEMAPQIDYALKVFKPVVEKFGVHFDCDIKMRGFYPKGGGEVHVRVRALQELRPLTLLERGNIIKIHGRAYVAGVLPFKMAEETAAAAVRAIRRQIKDLRVNIEAVKEQKACGNGNGIIIIGESSTGCLFAGSALGKKGVSAQQIGQEAGEMLLANVGHGGCVDEFLQDQLIVFMALAKGTSRIRTGAVTLHARTAIHVAQRMTRAKFTITKCQDEPNVTYIIECQGAGLPNPKLKIGPAPTCQADQ